jgi:hypothetical protein
MERERIFIDIRKKNPKTIGDLFPNLTAFAATNKTSESYYSLTTYCEFHQLLRLSLLGYMKYVKKLSTPERPAGHNRRNNAGLQRPKNVDQLHGYIAGAYIYINVLHDVSLSEAIQAHFSLVAAVEKAPHDVTAEPDVQHSGVGVKTKADTVVARGEVVNEDEIGGEGNEGDDKQAKKREDEKDEKDVDWNEEGDEQAGINVDTEMMDGQLSDVEADSQIDSDSDIEPEDGGMDPAHAKGADYRDQGQPPRVSKFSQTKKYTEWLQLQVTHYIAANRIANLHNFHPAGKKKVTISIISASDKKRKMMPWRTLIVELLGEVDGRWLCDRIAARIRDSPPKRQKFCKKLDHFSGRLHCEAVMAVLMLLVDELKGDLNRDVATELEASPTSFHLRISPNYYGAASLQVYTRRIQTVLPCLHRCTTASG